MIENHYELNIARNGQHYARVVFAGSLTKLEAQERAETIAMSMQEGSVYKYNCTLTHIECVGREVSF